MNPSASQRTMYYDWAQKGALYVTPIEISNGFGIDRFRASL